MLPSIWYCYWIFSTWLNLGTWSTRWPGNTTTFMSKTCFVTSGHHVCESWRESKSSNLQLLKGISYKIALKLFFFFCHFTFIFPPGILVILNVKLSAILAAKSNIASLGLTAWTSLPNRRIPHTGNQKCYFHSEKQHCKIEVHVSESLQKAKIMYYLLFLY